MTHVVNFATLRPAPDVLTRWEKRGWTWVNEIRSGVYRRVLWEHNGGTYIYPVCGGEAPRPYRISFPDDFDVRNVAYASIISSLEAAYRAICAHAARQAHLLQKAAD